MNEKNVTRGHAFGLGVARVCHLFLRSEPRLACTLGEVEVLRLLFLGEGLRSPLLTPPAATCSCMQVP